MGRHVVAQEDRALRERHARALGDEVLQQERHTGEWSCGVGRDRAGSVDCLLEGSCHDRVQQRVERLDPFDRALDQLDGRDVASAHEGGLPHGVERRELARRCGDAHRPMPRPRAA